jgi:hypothetical protein
MRLSQVHEGKQEPQDAADQLNRRKLCVESHKEKFIIVHPVKNVQGLPNRYFKSGLRGLVFGLGSVLRLLEVG